MFNLMSLGNRGQIWNNKLKDLLGRACTDFTSTHTAGHVHRVTLKAKSLLSLVLSPNCSTQPVANYSFSIPLASPGESHTGSWKVLWPSPPDFLPVYKAQSFTTAGVHQRTVTFVPRGLLFHVLEGVSGKVPKESEFLQASLGQGHSTFSAEMRRMPPPCLHVTLSPGRQG